jgi:hypothetical protein
MQRFESIHTKIEASAAEDVVTADFFSTTEELFLLEQEINLIIFYEWFSICTEDMFEDELKGRGYIVDCRDCNDSIPWMCFLIA